MDNTTTYPHYMDVFLNEDPSTTRWPDGPAGIAIKREQGGVWTIDLPEGPIKAHGTAGDAKAAVRREFGIGGSGNGSRPGNPQVRFGPVGHAYNEEEHVAYWTQRLNKTIWKDS